MSTLRLGVRWLFGCALLIAAFIFGGIGAVAGTVVAASVLESPAAFLLVGLSVAAVVTMVTALLATWILGFRRRMAISVGCGGLALVLVGGLVQIFFLRPLVEPVPPDSRALPPGATHWDLPTGSRIALLKIDGRGPARRTPIVFLHGGPGAYSVALTPTVSALSALAGDGNDLYFYDQVGGGLSARLDDIRQYSLERHLVDLDALHARIGTKKIILIGSSFGASLGANYIARRSEHVAAAVFSGPGAIFYPAWKAVGDGKIDDVLTPSQRARMAQMVERPRLLAAIVLAQINPRAAARFAPEEELGPFFDEVANAFYVPATVCKGRKAAIRSDGYGFWSNWMTSKALSSSSRDPRPRLREVATPVLILRGFCDYKKEEVAQEYVEVFANSRFQHIDAAGHMPYLDRPDAYVRHVRQFLSEVRTRTTTE